jgi:RHS repeat-associated protein
MANGDGPAGPASAVQGFVGSVMTTITAPIDAANLAVAKATLALLEVLPKMPAVRLYSDLVFQFGHSHPHPPSFGFPLPSTGPLLASGCMSVLINGQPAARNGDMGLAIWCGGYFPIFELITGSSHVFIGGARAARSFMDVTLHCLPDPLGGKWGLGKLDIAMAVFGAGMSALNVAASMEQQTVAENKAAASMLQSSLAAEYADEMAADTSIEVEDVANAEAEAANAAAEAEAMAARSAAAGVGTATAAAQMAADVAAIAMGLLMGKDPGIGFPLGMMVTGSPNVLIGGFPMPGWDVILKGLFKLLRPVLRRIQLKMPQGRLRRAACALTGHPVDVASGRMVTSKIDFEIDGRIPIIFERSYDTASIDYESPIGWGWTHPYDQHLWENKRSNCIVWRDRENRQVRFDRLKIGEKYFQPLERVWLERTSENDFVLTDLNDGLNYCFGSLNTLTERFDSEATALRLLRISDRNDNQVDLVYNDSLLSEISNGSGTFVSLSYRTFSGKTRLAEIRQNLKNGQNIGLMQYFYDGEGDLISATDRTYVPFTYFYEGHLMTRETNRNGLSFYFEYDGEGTNARCIHTWGDGGIYERWLTYAPKAWITRVKDGLGGETVYHYNELDLVTKIFNADGGTLQFEYGFSGELVKETDEIGRVRTFTYDAQLTRSGMEQPDGTVRSFGFNQYGQPVTAIDESGAVWNREYDERGNIRAVVDPLGTRHEYETNLQGDIVRFRDHFGAESVLDWSSGGQIVSIERPGGLKTSFVQNERNAVYEVIDEFTGIRARYSYDDIGRVIKTTELNRRGETISVETFGYDPEGNTTSYIDPLGHRTLFKYAGFNKLVEEVDALGFKRSFNFDSEGRLSEVINERRENYKFEYNGLEDIVAEVGYDGSRYDYRYNPAGELIYQKDALERETHIHRDVMGRETRRIRSDASNVEFEYDVCGRITTARNAAGVISRTYDPAWQLITEEFNGHLVAYSYDPEGRRTSRISSSADGSSIVEYRYDSEDNLISVVIGGREIHFERDAIGRLTRKINHNGLEESFEYAANGRLSTQRITVGGGGREVLRRSYEWDATGNVLAIGDSFLGDRSYRYDAVGRLNRAERLVAGGVMQKPETPDEGTAAGKLPADKRLWQADAAGEPGVKRAREIEEFRFDGDGNLIERASNIRRSRKAKYGRGDKLERLDQIRFVYDAVGNLISKTRTDGTVVNYEYDFDNQLVRVSSELEAGSQVEFRYDAFGRRVSKSLGGRKTEFAWDGDVLLSEKAEVIQEYVHEQFVPVARLRAGKVEAYHTDYMGTPKELSADDGSVVWHGNYDEYGRVSAVGGETEQNLRFQGQYEDPETGLHYNFFRYYDPDAGRYINQDPIGLQGGLNTFAYVDNPLKFIDVWGLQGGSYYSVRSTTSRGEVHHIPAHSSYKNLPGSNIPSHGTGPAIWMTKADHHMTASHGSSAAAKAYRARQTAHIASGNWAAALRMDIDDIQMNFGSKYNASIRGAIDRAHRDGLITDAQRRNLRAKC